MDYVNRILEYDLFTLYDITLAPMVVREFPADGASTCFGTIYVYGNIAPVGTEDWPVIANHREWRPREVWGKWKADADSAGTVVFQASSAGARWLCLADNGRGRPEIVKQSVEKEFVVPELWGALICWTEGDVVLVDDQQAMTSQFVAPREVGITITGACDILLVREANVA